MSSVLVRRGETQTQTHRRECPVKTEADTGVMGLQAKECQELPTTEAGRKLGTVSALEPPRQHAILTGLLASEPQRKYTSVAESLSVYAGMLWHPYETNTESQGRKRKERAVEEFKGSYHLPLRKVPGSCQVTGLTSH